TIAVVLLLALGFVVVLWQKIVSTSPNETYYSVNKNDTKNQVETLLADITPKGLIVYSNIEDRGCNDNGSVGLAVAIKCDYIAYKYAIHHDSLSADMHEIDAMIAQDNWSRSLHDGQSVEEFEQALDGKVKTSMRYRPLDS